MSMDRQLLSAKLVPWDTLALLGTALGLSLASGLSLYGAAFLVGLSLQLGWVRLGPGWEALAVLADPLVLAVAGVLFAIEFLADKVPWLDSAWDAVHTVIRPIGGALLASRVFGDLHSAAELTALLRSVARPWPPTAPRRASRSR